MHEFGEERRLATTHPAVGVPPYAAPIAAPAAPLSGAVGAGRIGPYVPASLRRTNHSAAPAVQPLTPATVVSGAFMDAALFGGDPEPLPSIDEFLDTAAPSSETPWVMQGAVRELSALSNGLAPSVGAGQGTVPSPAPLPAWHEGDLGDPTPRRAAPVIAGTVANPGSTATTSAESAALALELLALRVRAGELVLPGYDPKAGDAGALVAALAALLDVRMRPAGNQ